MFNARAQDEEQDPGRGVARVSVMNGDVSIRRGDSGDFIAAAINAPLVVQDHLVTGGDSRAEVQLDWANMIRLSANTEVRFAELTTRRYQVQLSTGLITFRVLRDTDAEVEIDTPSVSVRPVKKGAYRIAVLANGDTEITVRSGEAEIASPRGVERLRSGRTMLARGSANDPEFQVASAIPNDGWDRWNEQRDHDLDRSRSYEYVSRDVYGADDLDQYGRWVNAPPYGWVWCPAGVAADWAPYRAGRWAWVDWYGWTWVSYEPWGWAPYHYGRWFYQGPYGWCWFPGPRHQRHYWAPGLVAFFGWGGGAHVGIGFGSVGWVPLAPYETYHRWYGRGFYGGYRNHGVIVNNVHVVNNVNITNVYRNARVGHGITGINGDEFARGGRGRGLRISDIPGSRANLVQGAIPVTPGRESLRITNREVTNVARPAANEHFFSRRQPAPVDRVPFEDQRRGMDRMVRGTFPDHGGAGQTSRAAGADPAMTRQGNSDRGQGWRRIGENPQATRSTEPARSEAPTARPSGADNWRRFGGRTESGMAPSSRQPEAGQGSRQSETRQGDNSNWRRFGGRENAPVMENHNEPSRREAAPRDESPRYEQQRTRSVDRSEPRNETQRYSAPRSEPLHISPPIVRERQAAPRYENPGGGNRGGGGPQMSAPQPRGASGGSGRTESRGGGGGRGDSGRSDGGRSRR